MHDLGTLPGSVYSSAYGINNSGQIVGTCFGLNETRHAFLWEDGQMQDLNDRVPAGSDWVILDANAINDRGQIAAIGAVGVGFTPPGATEHALLLSPASLTPPALPQAPTNLSAVMSASKPSGSVALAWTDNSNNESGFEIQRQKRGGKWEKVTTVAVNSTAFEDNWQNLEPYTHYTYRVRALNELGTSDWSNEASVDTGLGALIGIYPDEANLGSQRIGIPSSVHRLSITNGGTADLTLTSLSVSGANAAEFTITDRPTTIAPGETGSISIVFTPAAAGTRTADLTVASNALFNASYDHPNPLVITLTGAGTQPAVRLDPTSLDFGQQPVGTTNGAQAVLLQNNGTAPLSIGTITISGADAADFALVGSGCSGSLQPGDTCLLNIRFKPAAAGSRSATLVISDDADGSPHLVSLSGEGIAPLVSIAPASLTFSEQPVGTSSDEQSVALSNTGSAPVTIYSVSLTGANPGDFVIAEDISGFTLSPGLSGTLTLRFKPTAPGSRSATLLISDSAAGSPHTLALAGTGTAPSVTFGISRLAGPSSLSFGTVPLGTSSAAQSLTLTNSGTAPLTIGGIALTGAAAADYQITADSGGTTLAPGASRTLTLRFTPMGLDNSPASVVIHDNAASGQQSVGLSGAGVLPDGHSRSAALVPTSGELFIAAIDGIASHSKTAVISVGQSVTVKLMVQFPNGAGADVSADAHCSFGTSALVGKFTAKNVWSARPGDAGRTVTLSGSYRSPVGRKRIQGTVTVTVRGTRRGRR